VSAILYCFLCVWWDRLDVELLTIAFLLHTRFVVLGGSLFYTIVKMREGNASGKKASPASAPKQISSA
jgi:hypothetical protein